MDGFAYPDLTEYREALALHTAVHTATAAASNARAQATNALMDTLMFLAPGLHPAVLAHTKVVHALHEEQIQFFRNAAWTASGKYTDVAMALFDTQLRGSQLVMQVQQTTASSDASKAAADEMAAVVANVRAENARLQAALDQQHAAMVEELQAANQRADQRAQQIKTAQHERDSLRRQLTKLRSQVRRGAAAVPVSDGDNAHVNARARANASAVANANATADGIMTSENGVDQAEQAARPTQAVMGGNRRQQARTSLTRPTKASELHHAAIQQEREAKKKALDAARAKDMANATTPDRTRTGTRLATAARPHARALAHATSGGGAAAATAVIHAAANPARGARD